MFIITIIIIIIIIVVVVIIIIIAVHNTWGTILNLSDKCILHVHQVLITFGWCRGGEW